MRASRKWPRNAPISCSRTYGCPCSTATRQIRVLPGLAAIPIIAVNSFAMNGDEVKAKASGCEDNVTKHHSHVRLLRMRGFLGEKW